jgi:large subunit ribosomal protein L28
MRICEITGKSHYIANMVSHAQNRTKKRQYANLQDKRIFIPETGRFVRLTLSTRAIRTINKIGLRGLCEKFQVSYDAIAAREA